MPKGICHDYTEVQKQFLSDNRSLPRKELTTLFNTTFGTHQTQKAISAYCKRHGWLTGRDGRIQKGNQPWNTGTKGVCKPNSGSFQKGSKPNNQKPFGHERICSKDGYVFVKVDEQNPHTGYRGRYRPKHHVIWEESNGPIPKGSVLRFVDGNKLNCDLDNLVCITQAVNQRLNKNKVNELPSELRGTAIALARLEVTIFQKEKQGGHQQCQ